MMVPAGHAQILEGGSPIVGDPDAICQAAMFLGDVSEDCISFGQTLATAVAWLSDGVGAAVAGVRRKLSITLTTGAESLQTSADTAKTGFVAYAAATEEIHQRAQSVQRNIDDHLGVIRSESAAVTEIAERICCQAPNEWLSPPSPVMPTPVLDPRRAGSLDALEREAAQQTLIAAYEGRWRVAVVAWLAAIDGIAAENVVWRDLSAERRRAEHALIATLQGTELGQLISLGSGPGGPGSKYTIARTIAGELWGEQAQTAPAVTKTHPGLAGLFAGGDATGLWDAPPSPKAAAAWWSGLDESTRECLLREAPWVIGNLPGLPYSVRDTANRELLAVYARHPEMLSSEQLKVAAEVRDILRREAAQLAEHGVARPPIQLVCLELTADIPKVAIGYGDSDFATHTTWASPGMQSDAHQALSGWDAAARNLHDAQKQVLKAGGASSVVTWLGYDSPGISDTLNSHGVLSSDAARAGATRLAAELDGVHVARSAGGAGPPGINVIAHSYGTTVASIALTQTQYSVDTVTFIASAGLDRRLVPNYEAMHVREVMEGQQAIYTTHASQDHLAPSGAALAGRAQPNPEAVGVLRLQDLSPVYAGGLSFPSDGDPSRELLATNGHSIIGDAVKRDLFGMFASYEHGYFDRDTQALNSIAQITTDTMGDELLQSLSRTDAACVSLRFGLTQGLHPERTACAP